MTGKPQPDSVRSRILHVFSLYTHVDAPLLARALRQPTSVITGNLHSFMATGTVQAENRGTPRRPLVRTMYTLTPAPGGQP